MRLLVLTPAELTRDPRARRAVATARSHGFDVVGVSGRASGEPPAPLDDVPVRRVGRSGGANAARDAGLAPQRRPLPLREARGIFRILRLALRTAQLARAGLRVGDVDVVHANDLDSLPAGWIVARRRRARLVYDAHELYADFEADPPRLYRRFSLALEGALARRADAVVTVSDPLAEELGRRLALDEQPLVVLNAPALVEEAEPSERSEGPLRAVYTGAFGSGRPLSDLLDALERAPSVTLTLFVVQFPDDLLRREAERRGLGQRVSVRAPVPPDELVETLREFDVGIVFDRPVTRNAELSLPNKLFEYLMAGLAVVAPRLPGMTPLLEESGAAVLVAPARPQELGAALEELAGDRKRLERLRAAGRAAATTRFNAGTQEAELHRAWFGGPLHSSVISISRS